MQGGYCSVDWDNGTHDRCLFTGQQQVLARPRAMKWQQAIAVMPWSVDVAPAENFAHQVEQT